MSKPSKETGQSQKFQDLAREVEADEDEAAFDEKLRQMRPSRDRAPKRDEK